MSEAADHPEEPHWVAEMRAAGYTVRVGTGTRGLSYLPEVSFHDAPGPRPGLRRRITDLVQRLWNHGAPFRRRIVHR